MPLYTYVVSCRGATHACQARRSNYQGFGDWAKNLPQNFLTPSLRKEALNHMYAGFEEVPNLVHTWRKEFPLGGSAFAIIAVQTGR
jgi:hypothetical protein